MSITISQGMGLGDRVESVHGPRYAPGLLVADA
jgi:hypothetical protein